jgi:hypothetical protein
MLGQKDRGPSTRAALAQDDRRSQNRVPMRTTKERIRSALSEPSPASSAGEGVGEGPSCARFAAKRALQSFVQQTTLRSAGTRRRAIRNAARRKRTPTHNLSRAQSRAGASKRRSGQRAATRVLVRGAARGPARGSASEDRHPALPRSTPTSILPQDNLGRRSEKDLRKSRGCLAPSPSLFWGRVGVGSIGGTESL